MIDFTLERRISDLSKLKEQWSEFRKFYRIGEHKKQCTSEQEDAFLECKKNIALLHEEFTDTLPQGNNKIARRMEKQAKTVIDHVIHCVSIKHVRSFYDTDHKLFEADWNGVYLLLNETIGLLEDRREQMANMSHASLVLSRTFDSFKEKTTALLKGAVFKLILILGILVLVPYFLHTLKIYELTRIPNDVPMLAPVYRAATGFLSSLGLNLAYSAIDQVHREEDDRPNGYRSITLDPNEQHDIAAIWVRMEWDLSGNQFTVPLEVKANFLDSSHERWRTGGGGGPLDLYLIRFKDGRDVMAFLRAHEQWVGELSSEDRQQVEEIIGLGRLSNVLIIAISPHEEAREYFIKKEFGAALAR